MTYQPQLQSRLLGLPREMRDQIYELTFSDQNIHVGDSFMLQPPKIPVTRNIKDRNAGLILACKQLHQETLLLYYKLTSFQAWDSASIREWLAVLRPECIGAIKEITRYGPGSWASEQAARISLPHYLGSPAALLQERVIHVQVLGDVGAEYRTVRI